MLAVTHSLADQAAVSVAPIGEVGRSVEPQLGELDGVGDGGALGRGERGRRGGQALARQLRGELVVDRPPARAAGLAEHLAELGEHLAELADVEPAAAACPASTGGKPPGTGRRTRTGPGVRRRARSRLVLCRGPRSDGPKPNGTSLMAPPYAVAQPTRIQQLAGTPPASASLERRDRAGQVVDADRRCSPSPAWSRSASAQFAAGTRKTVAPTSLATSILNGMPLIGPTAPNGPIVPVPALNRPPGELAGRELVDHGQREHQPGRRPPDVPAGDDDVVGRCGRTPGTSPSAPSGPSGRVPRVTVASCGGASPRWKRTVTCWPGWVPTRAPRRSSNESTGRPATARITSWGASTPADADPSVSPSTSTVVGRPR